MNARNHEKTGFGVGSARQRLSRLPYGLAVGAIALLVISLACVALWQEKQRYRERASVATQNVAQLLAGQIENVFDKIDVVLETVVDEYRDRMQDKRLDPVSLNAFLARQEALLPEALSLRIVDREGIVRLGKGLPADNQISLADRDYFQRLRDDPADGLVVSGPVFGRIAQQWVIVLARRINGLDGSFAGVVYATMATAHFEKVFSNIALGPKGAATIRTTDLSLVHRYPDLRGAVGSNEVSKQLREIVLVHPDGGEYIAVTPLDGIERSNAYRKLERYPFYLIVGLATNDYLGGWNEVVLMVSGLAGLAILVTALAARLVYRSARRMSDEIEERKRIGGELQVLLAERTRLNEELALRADEAEAANRAKSAFLGNMSHELRTPLNHIMGFASLLKWDLADGPGQARLSKIEQASRHLLGLINDILDLARIEAEQIKIETLDFELGQLLNQVERGVQEAAAAKGLALVRELAPDLPDRLRGDPVRLAQVLGNLLDNAVKFSTHGPVSLRVRPTERLDDLVILHFEVEDHGLGIDPALQDKLFQRFHQGDNSLTRRFGGTGLGLAISKRLVMLMGGEIGYSTEPGVGSIFWFSVPLPLSQSVPVGAGEAGDVDWGHVRDAVAYLADLLAESDMQAQTLWGKNPALFEPVLRDQMAQFRIAIDNFDFETALELLREAREATPELAERQTG
jgi:signal transduction histidine kinase